MAGLPWIKVWTKVAGHPKVQRLEREMGIKDGLGVLLRLWCWTADYAPDGEIPEAEVITAVRFARGDVNRKPPAVWLAALTMVGLLDHTATGYRVHDWDDMQTRHVEADEKRRAQAAERQKRYRERHGNASPNASRDGDVTPSNADREEEEEDKRERKKETEADRTVSLNPRSPTPPFIVSGGKQ